MLILCQLVIGSMLSNVNLIDSIDYDVAFCEKVLKTYSARSHICRSYNYAGLYI